MALLQRKSVHAGEQTFHKALCNLWNRELKITCSGMIACACGMNKRSVECECVCMRLMSDSSVDGTTATVLHWLCATQVKKETVLSYYEAHKCSSKLFSITQQVIQWACMCVCVCVCTRACLCACEHVCVWVKLLPICGMLGLFCVIFILYLLPGFLFHVAARKPEEGFKGTSLVSSWWPCVSWLRVWQFEACDQLMTPCFLAPCVTIWGLWPADDPVFPGSVCDNLRLVTSWWHHVSWLRVWQFEACDQLMTPCFLAPCVTIWGLWPADDTMFPGSVCDNLRLVTSWWHHVSWLRVWQFEACDQLMTPCFLAPCVTIWGLWPADDTMFPGSMCDKLRPVSGWHHVSWFHVWQIEACEQLMTPCSLDPCVTNWGLWPADDTMFPGSMCDEMRPVTSWWHHVPWIHVWRIEACDQLMTPCSLDPCVTNWALWPADDTMFPGSMCDELSLVTSWWPCVSWIHVWQIGSCEQLMTPCFLAPCVKNWA